MLAGGRSVAAPVKESAGCRAVSCSNVACSLRGTRVVYEILLRNASSGPAGDAQARAGGNAPDREMFVADRSASGPASSAGTLRVAPPRTGNSAPVPVQQVSYSCLRHSAHLEERARPAEHNCCKVYRSLKNNSLEVSLEGAPSTPRFLKLSMSADSC